MNITKKFLISLSIEVPMPLPKVSMLKLNPSELLWEELSILNSFCSDWLISMLRHMFLQVSRFFILRRVYLINFWMNLIKGINLNKTLSIVISTKFTSFWLKKERTSKFFKWKKMKVLCLTNHCKKTNCNHSPNNTTFLPLILSQIYKCKHVDTVDPD